MNDLGLPVQGLECSAGFRVSGFTSQYKVGESAPNLQQLKLSFNRETREEQTQKERTKQTEKKPNNTLFRRSPCLFLRPRSTANEQEPLPLQRSFVVSKHGFSGSCLTILDLGFARVQAPSDHILP